MSNSTFGEIADCLKKANSVLIFTHVLMDGDALGSSGALCDAMRSCGKTSYILTEDKIPDDLMFLDRGYCTPDKDIIPSPDVCICLDAGDESRFPERADKFREGKTTICIDHHATSEPFCDLYHIDPGASSTSELVYLMLKEGGFDISLPAAESIFAGITTDTGNFQYSNTTIESHKITIELMEKGIDPNKVSIDLYENEKPEKIKLFAAIADRTEFYADGRLAMSCVTQEMLRETDCLMEDSEGIVSELRAIKGVQIAIILKENAADEIKATMRSKEIGDVSRIAVKHKGGGHVRAAGCTLRCDIKDAWNIIREDALEELGYK